MEITAKDFGLDEKENPKKLYYKDLLNHKYKTFLVKYGTEDVIGTCENYKINIKSDFIPINTFYNNTIYQYNGKQLIEISDSCIWIRDDFDFMCNPFDLIYVLNGEIRKFSNCWVQRFERMFNYENIVKIINCNIGCCDCQVLYYDIGNIVGENDFDFPLSSFFAGA
jgi:hypothetical protein